VVEGPAHVPAFPGQGVGFLLKSVFVFLELLDGFVEQLLAGQFLGFGLEHAGDSIHGHAAFLLLVAGPRVLLLDLHVELVVLLDPE